MKSYIAISGTGRAGTTFLLNLFHELNLDVGDVHPSQLSSSSFGGLEHSFLDNNLPYIVKSPALCDHIDVIVNSSNISLDLLIIPIRDLHDAAESRRRVTRIGDFYGGVLGHFSLLPHLQENLLAKKFYRLVFFASYASIPIVFLHFPKFAQDKKYLYSCINSFLTQQGIDYCKFSKAFDVVYKPDRIHSFESKTSFFRVCFDFWISLVLFFKFRINRFRVMLKIRHRFSRFFHK